MRITSLLCFLVLTVSANTLCFSQNREEKKYTLRAKEVDDEIMGAPDPFFTNNAVPSSYSNASAVILAKKIDLFSDLKSKVRFSIFYGKDVTNNIRYSLTIREKVKIQDKNSLSEYSEFSFNKIRQQSNFFKKSTNTFVGIRLIKPDGSVKTIDVDEEAVNAGDDDEKNKFKLAIPGLQVGDIVDLYSRVEKESKSDNPIEPLDIVMGGDYPIVNYSMQTKIRNDFAVIYTAANGAPNPEETRDDDFIYLKVNFKDVNKSPNDLWLYNRRELPVFKINIFPGFSSRVKKSFMPGKGEVIKGLSKDWIDSDVSMKLSGAIYSADMQMMGLTKEYIRNLKKQKGWKEIDRDSLINYLYYYGRFAFLYDYMSDSKIQVGVERNAASADYNFYSYFLAACNYYSIDYDFIVTVPRTNGTIYDAVSTNDFLFLVRAKGNNDYYIFPPTMYSIANTFPYLFEGQDAYVFKNISNRISTAHSVVEKLPYTKSNFNYSQEKLEVAVEDANPLQLNIQRIKSERGNLAYDDQVMLTLFEEYVDTERTRIGQRTFADEIMARVGKKKGTQLTEEYSQVFAEAKKKREEYAKKEVENTYSLKPVSFSDFKIMQTGNLGDQRDLVFKEKFTLEGIVKKAGSNYILTVGNLIGEQLQVKNDQRERKNNIYMPYARTFNYEITFSIPQGYTIEGIEALNKNIDNEVGSFTSKAKLENGKLIFSVNKMYNHYYESVSNWPKLLEIVDAAYDLSQQKILLKKL
jgi:hypothetical protein